MENLSLDDEFVFGQLCQRGAMIFYLFRDFRPGEFDEFEVGIVIESSSDIFDVQWCVIQSTSGCDGLLFHDRYTRGRLPEGRWQMLNGGIIDANDFRSELCWSSMPVSTN